VRHANYRLSDKNEAFPPMKCQFHVSTKLVVCLVCMTCFEIIVGMKQTNGLAGEYTGKQKDEA